MPKNLKNKKAVPYHTAFFYFLSRPEIDALS